MSCTPYTNLQATPDFTTFQFISPTLPKPTIRQVRFIGQQAGRIYQAEFRNKPEVKKDDLNWTDTEDFYRVVLTTVQIIEIYSERYPRRILRFIGDLGEGALVVSAILTRYRHLLKPLFIIESEIPGPQQSFTVLVKRKPIPFFSIHTIESTWNGTSRIFNQDFSIELDKSVRIGLTLPTM